MNALVFLDKRVLEHALEERIHAVRAKKKVNAPVVMTREEVAIMLSLLEGTAQLVVKLLYGRTYVGGVADMWLGFLKALGNQLLTNPASTYLVHYLTDAQMQARTDLQSVGNQSKLTSCHIGACQVTTLPMERETCYAWHP